MRGLGKKNCRVATEMSAVRDRASGSHGEGHVFGEVEGCALRLEQHGVQGARGSYRRLIVTCPLHGTKEKPCCKKRNTGVRQTRRLGENEPKAYLGSWLSIADKFTSRKKHMQKIMTDKQVRKYATRVGLY